MSKIPYYANPYEWIVKDLKTRENTKAIIHYILWGSVQFFINQTSPKTFSIRSIDVNKDIPQEFWIYENIPYNVKEEKLVLEKAIKKCEDYEKIRENDKIKITEKEKGMIQKEFFGELFFWDIIIPTLKKENLPYWKKSFDEFSKEQKNIFITLNKKINFFEKTLHAFSNLIEHDLTLHFVKNKEKSMVQIPETDFEILRYINDIRKIFHKDIIEWELSLYELSLNGLNKTQRSFIVYGDSKKTMTSHEKMKFKKFLKDNGVVLPEK